MSMMSTAFRYVLLSACLVCAPAWAAHECFADLTGDDAPYTDRLDHDPHGVILSLLKAQRAASADAAASPSAAHIDAMLMEAYFAVGDIPQALEAATLGLSSLVPADGVGLQRRLQFRRLVLLNANGQLRQAAEAAEADAAAVPDDAPELICVLIERGYLRLRTDRVAAAASDLIRAASLAREQHLEPYRFEANGILSMLYARDGFRAEAMALADEAVAYYEHGPEKQRLADAYFRRGDANLESGNYAAAEPDFWKAISLSREVAGIIDVSAGEQRMCKVLVHLPEHRDAPDAREFCTQAYARAPLRDSESARLILASLGEIELADQHPAAAVAYLDRALSPGGAELSGRTQMDIRRLRGRARQMLGDTAGALQDMTDVMAWLDQERLSSTAERVSLLHVKTELEQRDMELARARAADDAARREASRQAVLRNLIAVAAMVGTAAVIVIAWLLRRRGQIDAARQAAEARLSAIGKLTGGIAHEFNNRLTVIQQAAWLLARRAAMAVDPHSLDLIAEIDRSTRASAEITGQLLSFSRQQHLDPVAVNLAAFLRDIQPTLQRIVGTTVLLTIEASDDLPPVWVDTRQLTAALLNLASNGRDAMGRSGTLTIRVSRETDTRVRIDVRDTGSGMSAEVLARATDPFFTTKAVGAGSGLGLSMVDGFARQSGGELRLQSGQGGGTTVTLVLPMAPA